jgi:hypothetical protein
MPVEKHDAVLSPLWESTQTTRLKLRMSGRKLWFIAACHMLCLGELLGGFGAHRVLYLRCRYQVYVEMKIQP